MPSRRVGALLVAVLRHLPLHTASRAAGSVARWRLPRPLRRPLHRAFGRALGVDFAEVRDPLDTFPRLQDFFTRALPEGARPLDPDPRAVVAPCDGIWGASGRVDSGSLLQVKGQRYALAALLGDATAAPRFEGGHYATFYLAPRDYHRFHAPCSAAVTRAVHVPGSLWPVNRLGVEGVPGLFARNERICAFLRLAGSDREDLCIAAVGATLVGRVRLAFDTLVTHSGARAPVWRHYEPPQPLARGEEWGRFEFGSTLVLVAAPGALALEPAPPGTRLRLGRRIGTLAAPAPRPTPAAHA